MMPREPTNPNPLATNPDGSWSGPYYDGFYQGFSGTHGQHPERPDMQDGDAVDRFAAGLEDGAKRRDEVS